MGNQHDDEIVRINISDFRRLSGCDIHKKHVNDLTSKMSSLLSQFAHMVTESVAFDVSFGRCENGGENAHGFGGYGYRRRGGGGISNNNNWKVMHPIPQQHARIKHVVNKDFDSSFAKMLISSLNKLTEQNFARLLPEIEKSLKDGGDDDNQKLCEFILMKCCNDHTYIPLYTRLFGNMVMRVPILNDFVHESLEFYRVECFDQPDVKDYDEFCLSNRKLHHAMGRNVTILHLIALRAVSISRKEYIRNIIMTLHDAIRECNHRRSELMLDIIMKILNTSDIGARSLSVKETDCIKLLVHNLNSDHAVMAVNKLRFKLMHINDILRN